ncbi:MAG: FHA domain-containing protein [Clostridiales bacterium]|nr:FHA domain-containing protein [Clostridiales bacterium]
MDTIFEIKNHGLENFLLYWVQEEQKVEHKAVEILKDNPSTIVETLEEVQEDGKYGFQYNIAYKATLRKYLMQTMGKEEVLKLLGTIIEAYKLLKSKGIDERYLYLNLDYIFVDFVTRDISFLCIPEDRKLDGNKSLREFLKDLLMSIAYKEEEDIYYIAKLVVYISNNRSIEVENFEELVLTLKEAKIRQSQPQVTVATGASPIPVASPVSSGMMKPAFAAPPMPHSMREETIQGSQPKPIKLEAAKPAPSGSLIANSQIGEHDETTVLMSPSGTLKEPLKAKRGLFQRSSEKKPTPVLIRMKNQEKIIINKNVFRIGKSKTDADYTVEDNVAISRVHAIIHKRDGACYIRDNDSTNNTYVNGNILKGDNEQLLIKGTKVSLADEEFIFDLV